MENFTNIDLLNKFQNLSEYVCQLYIATKKFETYELKKEMYNFYLDEERITSILHTVETISKDKKSATHIIERLLHEKNAIGELYELSAYTWLLNKKISFDYQVSTSKNKTLSKNCPILDGYFNEIRVYFDIKTFEVPNNVLNVIKEKIEKKFKDKYPECHVMLGGNKDVSYENARKYIIDKIDDVCTTIEQNIISESCRYIETNTNVCICFYEKRTMHSVISTFDCFKWAKENEMFFMKNVSQYTQDEPFIIICPFMHLPIQSNNSTELFYLLRALARRVFINLRKIIKEYSKIIEKQKIRKEINTDSIADYLSGILFINLEEKSSNNSGYLFLNPNAKNQIHKYVINSTFENCIIDDFEYDNY